MLLTKSPGSRTVGAMACFWSNSATWWSIASVSWGMNGIQGAWSDLSISEFRSIRQQEMVSKTKGSLVIFNHCLWKIWVRPPTGRCRQGRGVRVIAGEGGGIQEGETEGGRGVSGEGRDQGKGSMVNWGRKLFVSVGSPSVPTPCGWCWQWENGRGLWDITGGEGHCEWQARIPQGSWNTPESSWARGREKNPVMWPASDHRGMVGVMMVQAWKQCS